MGSAYAALWWLLPLTLSWLVLAARRLLPAAGYSAKSRSPPGPRPLPLLGNLPQLLGGQPHRALARLARVHGPIMSLRFGLMPVVVVSSPGAAKQVLHTHDHALSARAVPDAIHALRHGEQSMMWMPASAGAWRRLRRLVNAHLFTPHRLDATQRFRSQKVRELLDFVGECARAGRAVDVGREAFTTTLNLVSNTLFSADVAGHGEDSSAEFKAVVRGVMEETGGLNVADYFPVLRWVDPQGRRRREAFYFRRLHQLFDEMINRRLKSSSSAAEADAESGDFLDVLLDAHAGSELDRPTINSLLVDLFCAGSETSSTTVEWTMAELLRNPPAMAKARSELEDAMKGSGRETVEESDIGRMPYLLAVLKETLRLHSPPLLVPHRAEAAVDITMPAEGGGEGRTYTVPEGATVLVNAWAIGRDPEAWGSTAEAFRPERFLQGEGGGMGVDFKGSNMELIPFGAGRRMCPGLPLAARMVPLMLANLLWSFEWVLPEGMAPAELDLTERFGVTLCMAKPLLAIPRLQ